MDVATQITTELDRHSAEMTRLVEELKIRLLMLPDNHRIKRMAPRNCFAMRSSNLNENWSPEHHDFRKQYELLIELVEATSPDRAVHVIREAVDTGRIRPNRMFTLNLHPDVVLHLKTLLPAG
jgi:hypothetical protein